MAKIKCKKCKKEFENYDWLSLCPDCSRKRTPKIYMYAAIGVILLGLFALTGFIIGTCKMPNTTAFEITKKTGGENINDIILRAIKFKLRNKRKIYIYTKEEE